MARQDAERPGDAPGAGEERGRAPGEGASPIARAASLLGVLWVGVFAASFLFEMGAVRGGRAAFVEALGSPTRAGIQAALVVGGLLGHLGLLLVLRGRAPSLPGYARLTVAATLVGAVFALAHVAYVWWPRMQGATPIDVYAGLRERMPQHAMVGLYAVGVASIALLLDLLPRVAADRAIRRPATRRWYAAGTAALGVAFFALGLNATAVFVSGAPLFGAPVSSGPPVAVERPPEAPAGVAPSERPADRPEGAP